MDINKYKKLFIIEANEKIAELNSSLLALEKQPENFDLAQGAMRASHTIKSSAAAMNFMDISHLAHAMEDLLEQVRETQHSLEPEALEALFESVDALEAAVRAIQKDKSKPDLSEIMLKIKDIAESSNGAARTISKSESIVAGATETKVEPIVAIKVDVEVLDRLMNLTEELLVERMRLNGVVKRVMLAGDHQDGSGQFELLSKDDASQLKAINESFNRLFSDLQFNVVQARMIPLGQIFGRFPRMIRDLAKSQSKDIEFEMFGQDIELDRTIIDRLGEPLIHLLRNAVDHGIEKTGIITLSAKREQDKVLVFVENNGLSIDWQKVVNVASLRGKINDDAKKLYLNDIDGYKAEIKQLLYLGDVSTSEVVTEVSGRGVGLSIVKSAIESLGGSVIIDSPTAEGGTRFTLVLPLTLAIIQALLVRVSNQVFALPFSQVDRSVRISTRTIKTAFDQEVVVVKNEEIPLIRLHSLFGLMGEESAFENIDEADAEKSNKPVSQKSDELIVIVRRSENAPVGLVIDEMISEQDIVVKPFTGALKKSKGFTGVTLLGDGRPALILDVSTLL